MSIDSRGIRKIGIWLLLLIFVFASLVLTVDAPDAVAPVTFTLLFILEILFALYINPQQPVCAAYRFGIQPRSPPNR